MDPASTTPVEQPGAEAQGEGGSGDLYDLSGVPDHLREYVQEQAKAIEARVTPRFQEAADYRKRWEPYEGIEGLTDWEPEALGQLLQWSQEHASDPESFDSWLYSQAVNRGLIPPDQAAEGGGEGGQPEQPDLRQFGEQLFEQINGALEERLGPIEQRLQEADTAIGQAQVNADLDELQEKHDMQLDEKGRDVVLRLAWTHAMNGDEGNTLQKAFDQYLTLTGQAELGRANQALNGQPAPAIAGNGRPDTAPEEFSGFDDPALKATMRSRFGVG